jgi:hypothetical protein
MTMGDHPLVERVNPNPPMNTGKRCWLLHKWRVFDIVEVPDRRATVYEKFCEHCGKRDAEVGFWD